MNDIKKGNKPKNEISIKVIAAKRIKFTNNGASYYVSNNPNGGIRIEKVGKGKWDISMETVKNGHVIVK